MDINDGEFLRELVETPSPTGSETDVARIVRKNLKGCADRMETDTMGSVHAWLSGRSDGPSVMLDAHMDEVGLMVKYISEEGYLYVAPIGGVDASVLPGLRVDVLAQDGVLRGVIGKKPIHLQDVEDRKSAPTIDKLFIDLGMDPDKVKELVRIGDPIAYGTRFEELGAGFAASKSFDDRCGVYLACEVMKKVREEGRAQGEFMVSISSQEEIGLRGAITSAFSLSPDVAIAFDVTFATDFPGMDKTRYGDIRCGAGPVIARGPNINPVVYERLVKAAEEAGISYQVEGEPGMTGTDAQVIQVSKSGIPAGLVSIPLRYMHTPSEVIALSDLENAVELIARFILDLEPGDSFIPGFPEGEQTEDEPDEA
ncbi:MAG: M42 family metallopeptidase [Eggerthellaceae bacterium]|nr:M42 family metallopeptidase [Eggerthellaceae bacterium]